MLFLCTVFSLFCTVTKRVVAVAVCLVAHPVQVILDPVGEGLNFLRLLLTLAVPLTSLSPFLAHGCDMLYLSLDSFFPRGMPAV